ncbi:hypothetical protein CLU79DRAFT_739919 [Phycomyces nitens]|nr:hypothetical protein CLU79DRAFT_739919 [Phycomyces nitens]
MKDAVNLRRHLLHVHQLHLPALPHGKRHFDTDEYIFVKLMGHSTHKNVKHHFACPSCLDHFGENRDYVHHIETNHLPLESTTAQENNLFDQIRDSSASDTNDSSKKRSLSLAVSVLTNKRIVTFSSTDYLNVPNTPKIPDNMVNALGPIVSIQCESVQESTLKNLKRFKYAHQFLLTALDQELEDLPLWLWQQKSPVELSKQEKKLWKIICFSLTSFADTCTETTFGPTSAAYTHTGNDYERTWWVRRVVPVFQTFANQTGLLSFDWCECEVKQKALADIDPDYLKKGRPWFADGLGYDWTGIERLVMEGSSGQFKENIPKTIDDSVKQIHNMINMLKGIAKTHLNSSFQTFLQTKIYGIQSIRTTIALSEVQMNTQGKFIHKQVLKATIPAHHHERNKWLGVINMVAYLLVALETQVDNLAMLNDEQDGKIDVETEDMVQFKLCPVIPNTNNDC